jgi:hypothetical protein
LPQITIKSHAATSASHCETSSTPPHDSYSIEQFP